MEHTGTNEINTPLVTIVIVNFNSGSFLERCLRSLNRVHPSLPFEILVVDNCSDDDSLQRAQKAFPLTQFLVNKENRGFARACNQGAQRSSAPFILFLNPDTEATEGFLENMVKAIKASPQRGIVGSSLRSPDGKIQESFGKEPTPLRELYRKAVINPAFEGKPSRSGKVVIDAYKQSRETDWVTGASMLVRRKVLEDVGFFDEKFFLYFEDVDLCLRAKEKNWTIHYTPEASIIHHGGVCSRNTPWKKFSSYRRSQLYYYRKKGNLPLFVLLLFYYGLKSLLSLLYFKPLELIKGEKGKNEGEAFRAHWELLKHILSLENILN